MVDVISRGWMRSSSKVPASAGEIPGGGSYMGATDMPGLISRPLYHHRTSITMSVTNGRKTAGFGAMNQKNLVIPLGAFRMPLGMYTSMVMPPRMGRAFVVSNSTVEPSTFAVASRSLEP